MIFETVVTGDTSTGMNTNKKTRVVRTALLSLAAVGLLLAAAVAAKAGKQDFILHNKTGVEIHRVYVSPHSADEWGEDILGRDTLDDGESVEITFSREDTAAHWDLRVEDKQGNSITWENLNLFKISEVTLYYKDGKAWAEVKTPE